MPEAADAKKLTLAKGEKAIAKKASSQAADAGFESARVSDCVSQGKREVVCLAHFLRYNADLGADETCTYTALAKLARSKKGGSKKGRSRKRQRVRVGFSSDHTCSFDYGPGGGGGSPPLPTRQCNDGIDNDGDGHVDYPNDEGCSDYLDDDETDPPLPPPSNDAFGDAGVLSGSGDSKLGDSRGATKQAGEPDHAGNPGGASVWYRWTPSQNGIVEVETCSQITDFDTLLAVYTASGAVPPFSNLTEVASNDDFDDGECDPPESKVSFTATAGTTYYIAADGFDGATGEFYLTLDFTATAPNDAVADAETLEGTGDSDLEDTFGATKQAGEPDHAGNTGGASVWYRWTPSQNGDVDIRTCSSFGFTEFNTLLAVYTASGSVPPFSNLTEEASNDDFDDGECDPPESKVSFTATAGTTYYIAVDGFSGAAGEFYLRLDQSV